jgi:carbohydrate kinase (thermoresistant glucokinase family)
MLSSSSINVLLMGVAGSGKTTVGKLLADRFNALFLDADDFHPDTNIEKMRTGYPLDELDRQVWIEQLFLEINRSKMFSGALVVACSALTASIQEKFKSCGFTIVHLKVKERTLRRRLQARKEHFFGVALLDSQLQALDVPLGVYQVNADRPLEEILSDCETIILKSRENEALPNQ